MSKEIDWGTIHGEGSITCVCDNCGYDVNAAEFDDGCLAFLGSSGEVVHAYPKVLFEYMKQFVGAEMRVLEAAGQYTVRTLDNKVVLSSACQPTDRFYCSPEKLAPHVGHTVVCVSYGQDEIVNISIECEDCNEVLLDIDAPEDGETPDRYDCHDHENEESDEP